METQSKAVEVWEESLSKLSLEVRLRYLKALDKFLKDQGIETAEELFQIRLREMHSDDPRDQHRVERKVEAYMTKLVKSGMNPNTAEHEINGIISFFKSQNVAIVIDFDSLPQAQSVGRKIILKDQIVKAWDQVGTECKLKNRAILMMLKDSGLRVGDVANLDLGDYRSATIVKNVFGEPFKVFDEKVTEKCGIVGTIHIGPEAIRAIEEYLQSERSGAKDDEPLFANMVGGRMTNDSISQMVKLVCSRLGKRLGAHSFRSLSKTLTLNFSTISVIVFRPIPIASPIFSWVQPQVALVLHPKQFAGSNFTH